MGSVREPSGPTLQTSRLPRICRGTLGCYEREVYILQGDRLRIEGSRFLRTRCAAWAEDLGALQREVHTLRVAVRGVRASPAHASRGRAEGRADGSGR